MDKLLSNGMKLITKIKHENPIAAAMDVPYIPKTRIPAIRPPPRLPPSYAAHLRDLENLRKVFEIEEREEAEYARLKQQNSILPLKFDSQVKYYFFYFNFKYSKSSKSSKKKKLMTPCKSTAQSLGGE